MNKWVFIVVVLFLLIMALATQAVFSGEIRERCEVCGEEQ